MIQAVLRPRGANALQPKGLSNSQPNSGTFQVVYAGPGALWNPVFGIIQSTVEMHLCRRSTCQVFCLASLKFYTLLPTHHWLNIFSSINFNKLLMHYCTETFFTLNKTNTSCRDYGLRRRDICNQQNFKMVPTYPAVNRSEWQKHIGSCLYPKTICFPNGERNQILHNWWD